MESIREQCEVVYNILKPGLIEAIYNDALCTALRTMGHKCEQEFILPLIIRGVQTGRYFKPDIIVDGDIIVELKAVNSITQEHKWQLERYLRVSGMTRGILVNFGPRLDVRYYTMVDDVLTLTLNYTPQLSSQVV